MVASFRLASLSHGQEIDVLLLADTTVCPFIPMYLNIAQLVALSLCILVPLIMWAITANWASKDKQDVLDRYCRAWRILTPEQKRILDTMEKFPGISIDEAAAVVEHNKSIVLGK